MATFLVTLFVIICLLLIVVVLLQKGRGGGLGGIFGGAGSSAFGTRTGDVFTWVTIILVAVFLVLAVIATKYFVPPPSLVPTPTFSPRQGPITETIRVLIQHDPKAEVYYTLDGSEPSKASLLYDDVSVPIRPGQTIKAKAFRRGMLDSQIAIGWYPHPSQVKAPATATAPTTRTAPATETAPAP
jgi:protein translocase SecG subunit